MNPTTLVEEFDGDAGEFIISGPERYDDGLWLESAKTNEATNPSVETALAPTLSGFYGWAGESISRPSGDANAVGTYCVECSSTTIDLGVQYYQDHNDTGDRVFSISVWLVSGATDWLARVYDSAANILASVDVTPTLAPQIVQLPIPALGAHTNLRYVFIRKSSTPSTIRLDAVQLETGLTASDYFDGSSGDGYTWSGTPHDSRSIRAAGSASIATTGIISPSVGAIPIKKFRRKMDTGAVEPIIDIGDGTSGEDRLRVRINASDKLEMSWQTNGAAETTIQSVGSIAVDTDYLLYVGWNGTHVELSVDNGTKVTGTRDAPAGVWGTAPFTLKAA